MRNHRGVGTLATILIGFGLLLLFASTVFQYEAQHTSQQAEDGKEKFRRVKESLITPRRNDEMSEYSLGVHYTLTNFFGYSLHIQETGGSMDSWCENGKVNRRDPEVLRTVTEILCGSGVQCEGIPYIFRPEADDRCYAAGTEFAVSGKVYNESGSLVSICMDATGKSGGSVANPRTLRCDPGGYVLHKEPWQ